MRGLILRCAAIVVAGLIAAAAASEANAQFLSPEAAMIRDCLCLKAAVDALGADMAGKQAALDSLRAELSRLDDQLQAERARMNVNNPEAVSRFRQLLEQRDGIFRQSTGQVFNDYSAAVDRYGARAQDYNARCAGRPMDSALMAQIQATLSCPPLY